jgi:cell division transport system permease protein
MDKKNKSRMAGMGDRVTSTISVTLVLFILGLVAAINITFGTLDKELKEKMGFTVVLRDSVSTEEIGQLRQLCATAPYVSEYKYLSSDDVLKEEAGSDGADLVEMLGVNPYSPVLDIRVKTNWANVDSIGRLVQTWSNYQGVDDVSVNTDMVENLTRNARLFNTIMLVIAAALLLISFVLINNTVRLTVYSRRFIIHTMKLVGATPGFIRRPFILSNIVQGIVAGIVASGLLAGLIAWGKNWDPAIEPLLPWSHVAIIFGGVLVLGMAICALAAALATNRYLRANYDEMFE